MALEPQIVPLIFEGLDTFTDPKRGILTKLDLLENCYISTPLKLQKRPGMTSQSKNIDGGGAVTAGAKLVSYRNELVMCDGLLLYTKDAISGLLAKRAKLPTGQIAVERVTGDTLSATRLNVSSAAAAGLLVYAWQVDTGGTVFWRIYDDTTGALLNTGSFAGANPKVVACGGFVFITYLNAGFFVRKIDPAAPTVVSAPTTIDAGLVGGYDVVADTATPQLLVAYFIAANTIHVRTISTAPVVSADAPFVRGGAGAATPISWLFHDYSNGSAYLSVAWTVAGVEVYDIDRATRAMSGATAVAGVATYKNITGYFQSATRTCFLERFTGVSTDLSVIDGWSQGVTFELARSCILSSKVFKNSGRYYIGIAYEDTIQRSRLLLEYEHGTNGANAGSAIVGFLGSKDDGGAGAGDGSQGRSTICDPASFGSGVYGLSGAYSFDLGAHFGVTNHRITFSETGLGTAAQFADELFIPGLQLNGYDGAEAVEAGFYLRPQAPTLASVGGGSKANPGTYIVKLVYRWTDAKGRVWRSQAGPTATIATGNNAIQVTAPTLRLTNKDPKFNVTASIPQVVIEAYCTTNGGTIFYLDSSATNSVTTNQVIFNLTQSDANLQTQQLLYQQGGVLGNEMPPAVRLVRSFQNRLFVCSGDGDIWHSKALTGSEGVGFSSLFRIPLDTSAGRVTALIDMDQTFMMGQRNGVYLLGGGAPTDTGTNLYGQPQRINTDIGPIDQASVARLPTGVAFNTPRGIHQMSRGLDSQFIGANVQRYTLADTITGAVVLDSRNHVAWTTGNGDLLVYDYVLSQWYVWTGLAAVACALYQNTLAILASDGTTKIEAAGVFSDDSTAIVMKLRTSWLALASFGGYQRLWSVAAIGEYKGAHQLQMSFAYNYSTFNNESLIANAGAATYNTGIEDGYVWEAAPKQQLCSAVQITVQDVLAGAGSEGFYLTGLSLEIGSVGAGLRAPGSRAIG